MLYTLLGQQYADGHVVHTFFPEEREAPSTSVHSDDHLWLPLHAYALVAETGDLDALRRSVPYLADDSRSAGPEATAWEHLLTAIRFTEAHLGTHDIPLTLRSDWNDIIGKFARKGRGESIFAGQQYVVALRRLLSIAQALGDNAAAEWLADCLQRQERALLACAWDGGWWRRGFDDDGHPVGSADAVFGKLFLNPQSWSIISGVGEPEQWTQAMDAVREQLNTPVGVKKLTPGFATWPEETDPFSGYAPGCGENGAIFCHANAWVVIAEALLGRGARAWEYFTQMMPHNALRTAGLQRYQSEPYAWVSNIVGPDNPRFGWANVPHVTGTAAWMDVAATQYLLGARPELAGLVIDPVLPPTWPGCAITRHYRGCMLDITVHNPHHVEHGVTHLTLDGAPFDLSHGPCLPPHLLAGKQRAVVEVTMG
jgi:cellobiose phosphorylase